jgi:hypothetical protein
MISTTVQAVLVIYCLPLLQMRDHEGHHEPEALPAAELCCKWRELGCSARYAAAQLDEA